ncbi:endogenous retrovirus group PABLB member 1 Env polyprotein-like [Alosa sapidissima]|uniref:endogenous retrovirus group PABLB member 1 Env polyprotein-like n=1 Tax=Alosa sapidissima TaxID=34773 RepID=UPI001C084685|nr:endogenous retrovirus group PABLB member 1 Env polyprotein-like [Alosa sapidissima]
MVPLMTSFPILHGSEGPLLSFKLSYAPRGVICWVADKSGRSVVGRSICPYEVQVGQTEVSIEQSGEVVTNALAPVRGSMFVCGQYAYSYLPPNWQGSCYLAYVVPAVRIVEREHLVGESTSIHPRTKRDAFGGHSIVATPTQRFFAALIPTYGLTVALDEIRDLVHIVDVVANDTARALSDINRELYAVRRVALQNRLCLDVVLASKGGACALIGQECCTYVPDSTGNVSNYIKDIYTNVQQLKRDNGSWSLGGWLSSWGGSLFAQIVQFIMPLLIPIFVIYLAIQVVLCIIKRATTTTPRLAPVRAPPAAQPRDEPRMWV